MENFSSIMPGPSPSLPTAAKNSFIENIKPSCYGLLIEGFSKEQVISALKRLGELAGEKSLQLNLCIYGGCAMMLAYDRKRITRDIDAVFHPSSKIIPLIQQVAKEQGLPDDWINDDVRQFWRPVNRKRFTY